MKHLLRAVTLLIVLLALSGCVANVDRTGRDIVVTVTSKEVIPADGGGRDYRIWTEIDRSDPRSHPDPSDDGVFNVNDDLLAGAEQASALYGQMAEGKRYLIHVMGRRYASAWIVSLWPNVVTVTPLEEVG